MDLKQQNTLSTQVLDDYVRELDRAATIYAHSKGKGGVWSYLSSDTYGYTFVNDNDDYDKLKATNAELDEVLKNQEPIDLDWKTNWENLYREWAFHIGCPVQTATYFGHTADTIIFSTVQMDNGKCRDWLPIEFAGVAPNERGTYARANEPDYGLYLCKDCQSGQYVELEHHPAQVKENLNCDECNIVTEHTHLLYLDRNNV